MRALIVCPLCEGDMPEGCVMCDGACTLIIPECEVVETDTVIERGLPDATPTK